MFDNHSWSLWNTLIGHNLLTLKYHRSYVYYFITLIVLLFYVPLEKKKLSINLQHNSLKTINYTLISYLRVVKMYKKL